MKFQVGDRVTRVRGRGDLPISIGPRPGMTGTVVALGASRISIGVQFDSSFTGGHDCCGFALEGCGWWCTQPMIKLIEISEDVDITANLEEVL